jgi:hypothetical protein
MVQIYRPDIDFAGSISIQSHDDILGNKYLEQINDSKLNDTVISMNLQILELCGTNKSNILELLNTPSDCIIYKKCIIFDSVLEHRDDFFLTKIYPGSFVVGAKLR